MQLCHTSCSIQLSLCGCSSGVGLAGDIRELHHCQETRTGAAVESGGEAPAKHRREGREVEGIRSQYPWPGANRNIYNYNLRATERNNNHDDPPFSLPVLRCASTRKTERTRTTACQAPQAPQQAFKAYRPIVWSFSWPPKSRPFFFRAKSWRMRRQRRCQSRRKSPGSASYLSQGLRLPHYAGQTVRKISALPKGCREVHARFRGLAAAHVFGEAAQVGGASWKGISGIATSFSEVQELGGVIAKFRDNVGSPTDEAVLGSFQRGGLSSPTRTSVL